MNACKYVGVVACLLVIWPKAIISQGTVVTDSVSSPGLAANLLGDRHVRAVVVYLPPSYQAERTRRYPVLYMLHGATSVPEEWLDGTSYQGLDLAVTLDSLIGVRAIPEMIVVMPNADNALGAHWYANSPALGSWEDFIVRDVVGHVDRTYRTDARRERRALFGHSMGGHGALSIGFAHPERFGFVYASSPALIAFTGRIAPTAPSWSALSTLTRWQDAPARFRIVLALAAALDGNRTNPRLFDRLPFTIGADGALVSHPEVQARWLERMPPGRAAEMVRRGGPRPIVVIEAGSRETEILDAIKVFRARLDSLGVGYADSTFEGGHIDKVRDRLTNHMLPAIASWLGKS